MKPKPLTKEKIEKLKEKIKLMLLKEVDVTNAKCEHCGRKVEACAEIGGTETLDKEFIDSSIFTYWSCEYHGAVGAILNGKHIPKPSWLFNKKFVEIDGEIYINFDFIIEKLKWLLKEIEKKRKEAEEETIRFKEYRNVRMFDFWDGKKEGLIEAKSLIKKTFEGVIE